MAETEHASGSFETRKDAGDGGAGVFRFWITALDLAEKHEADWRKKAQAAIDRFRDEKDRRAAHFNILYSSVQTIEPSIYNSTPIPDVRRRFGDEDPMGKIVAQAFERSLSHCLDEYDFDAVMEAAVHDMQLPGRGVALVAYQPTVKDDEVAYESVRCEHVQWDDFRHGPGKRWEDVPWIAVRYRITREEAIELSPQNGAKVNLDWVEKGVEKDKEAKDVPDIFKRLTVWKIWDKTRREIVFIAPAWKDGPFATEPDRLKLRGFFPLPRPMYDIADSTSLVPLIPYEQYKDQAEELDRITRRLKALISVLRWRGIRPSQITELDKLKDADDGELIPSESAAGVLAMAQTGGDLGKAIWLMPIDKLIDVIRELVLQREAIKQVVFEMSGLADIMRGETDPNETLGAQQIKAQWGSLRMQRRQREVQRFARDLFRMKAEIIGEHFAPETLAMVTGIRLPTPEEKAAAQQAMQIAQQTGQPPPQGVELALQAPTWTEVKQVMASDALRSFKVDIETDSTIQADQTRNQQAMANFVQGLAAFGDAVGPGMQAGVIPPDVVADLLSAFARQFKLGKQAEDALDRLGKVARQPQPPKQDPEQMKAEAEKARGEQAMALKAQEHQAMLAAKAAEHQQAMAFKAEEHQAAQAQKRLDADLDIEMAERRAAFEGDAAKRKTDQDIEARSRMAETDRQIKVGAANDDRAIETGADADGTPPEPKVRDLAQALLAVAQQLAQGQQDQMAQHADLMRLMAAPVRLVRDKQGRASGAVRERMTVN